jgi:nicotinamidase/pyrazinamidase
MRPATEALLVIDVQNDFCPGGALAVPGGDEIVPGINALMDDFPAVILTQDWHPAGHSSFASASIPARRPMTWSRCPTARRCSGPTIACRAAGGAAFHPDLDTTAPT